jgi:hypothetical protein
LAVVGPINAYGVEFSSQNFAMDLEQFVEFDFEKYGVHYTQRKAIIGLLSKTLIDKMENIPNGKMADLWLAFKKNIDQKQILVYLYDDKLQKYFSDRNWAGEIRSTDGDYLMVVDSNFASLKTDSVIKRSIKKTTEISSDGSLKARVEITYNHTGKFVKDLITRYRVYAKVYVPDGSWFENGKIVYQKNETPVDLKKDLEYGNEYDKSYAAYFMIIEPGESKTMVLEYKLPDYINDLYKNDSYTLLIQKQPGLSGHDLAIDLNFGKMISAYSSSILPEYFRGKTLEFKDDLTVDRFYKIKF